MKEKEKGEEKKKRGTSHLCLQVIFTARCMTSRERERERQNVGV